MIVTARSAIMTSFGLDMYCGVPKFLHALWIFIGKIESTKRDSQQWFVSRQNNGGVYDMAYVLSGVIGSMSYAYFKTVS